MASVLLIRGSAAGSIAADLVTLGHTLTETAATTGGGLDTAWGAGKDAIVLASPENTAQLAWITTKWAAGVPVIIGAYWSSAQTGPYFGFSQTETDSALASPAVTLTGTHPITTGFSGSITPSASTYYLTRLNFNVKGTALASYGGGIAVTLSALEVGDALYAGTGAPGSTAPARAVYMGWLQRSMTHSTDGRTIFGQAISWVTATVTIPQTSSSLPLTVGLPASVNGTTQFATSTLPLTVALPATVTGTVQTATSSLPLTVSLPATVGSLIPSVTSTLPFSVGLPAEASAVSGGAVALEPYDDDMSQRTLLVLQGADTILHTVPPLAVPPPTINVRMIRRNSVVMDPPELDADGRWRPPAPPSITEGIVGMVHLVVDGIDVTYFRDAATTIGSITRAQPFGDRTFSVVFPQVGPLEVAGSGDLAWLHPGASVEVFIAAPDDTRHYRFAGHFLSQDAGNGATDVGQTWQAVGALYQADLSGHRVPPMLDPTDIGTVIPAEFNSVISRRYAPFTPVTTDIPTRQRGSLDDSVIDYTSALLSTAWLEDGSTQWTVARVPDVPRKYVIRPKDRTTEHWTLTTGAPGVATALSRDLTAYFNCLYGRGVAADGYSWAGWMYPNLLADDAPPYPYSDPTVMVGVIGNTHPGVTTWQRRAVELGYRLVVDGVFNLADKAVAKEIQRDYGLLVDGVVGPQTWAATFDVGAAGGDLNAVRRPLAVSPLVEPRLYSANGADIGPNPAYDPSRLRIERDVDYGAGVTKAEAGRHARADLARASSLGWSGTITLDTDPHEGSRFLINEGENVRLLGFGGAAEVLLHVVEVSEDYMSETVTLTVDEDARDAMTLAAIRTRDRDSAPDPARRPGNINRRSRQAQDIATEFDGESGAGIIPRHAIFSGLWTVIRIPVSQVGRIATIDVRTESPTAKFCLALFGARVTPAHLVALVGDPLSGSDPFARTEAKAVALDNLGFIEAFGGPGSAAGYWPRDESGGALTGRMLDTGGLEYVSAKPPWVWVAEYSPVATFISGRIRPAPVQ